MRTCGYCGRDISSKRSDARYCSKRCLNHASYDLRTFGVVRVGREIPRGQEGTTCELCGASLAGMRPHARFCSRSCKSKAHYKLIYLDPERAAEQRRRDRERYVREQERRRAYALEYYSANADEARARSRAYRRNNPQRRRSAQDRRAAAIRAHPDSRRYSELDWLKLERQHDWRCAYCGQRPTVLVQDHVIPLSRGGRHAIANILPACRSCNASKYNHLLMEWRLRLARRQTTPLPGGDASRAPALDEEGQTTAMEPPRTRNRLRLPTSPTWTARRPTVGRAPGPPTTLAQ